MVFSHLYSSALDRELGTDDSTRLFTTARRKAAINEAQLDWADQTECVMRQTLITCSNGVGEYDLLSTGNLAAVNDRDFLRVAGQQPEFHLTSSGGSTSFLAGSLLPFKSINFFNEYDLGWRGSTGSTPMGWYLRSVGGGVKFGVVPSPRLGSSESGQILLSYFAKPTDMTSDTDAPFTIASTVTLTQLEPYHQGLVHYAASQLEKLRKDWQASQVQDRLYQGYLERYRRAQAPQAPRQMRSARNYFGEVRQRRSDPFRTWGGWR